MFKVLASLVVAMTVTTVLLAWVEPSSTSAQDLVPSLAAEQAQRVVTEEVEVTAGRWRQIDVAVCASDRLGPRRTLTALRDGSGFHFIVGNDGMARATRLWLAQRSIGEPPDAVRIAVAEGRSGSASVAQQVALRALLLEISQECAPPGGWRAIRVHDADDGHERSPLAGVIRNMLLQVGLTT